MSLIFVVPLGPFESNGRKQLSLSSCGFDPFKPVQNHIGSEAGKPAQCYVRFGHRVEHILNCNYCFSSSTYGGYWTLSVVMALASLRFQRNAQDYEETRQGMTVFIGDAASFHERQFRLQIKKS